LNDQTAGNSAQKSRFKMFNSNKNAMQKAAGVDLAAQGLDQDGLPFIGKKMEYG
jgi:hypothetical protein